MEKDEALDSIVHHEERAAKMRAASEEAAQLASAAEEQRKLKEKERNRVERHAQADEMEAKVLGIIHEGETRDMLLERIRKLREDVPPEVVHEGYMPPGLRAQLEREQQDGREAVARSEAQEARYRDVRMKAEEEERLKTAVTVPVHHPNPSQDEVFPTVKATLPGSGQVRKK